MSAEVSDRRRGGVHRSAFVRLHVVGTAVQTNEAPLHQLLFVRDVCVNCTDESIHLARRSDRDFGPAVLSGPGVQGRDRSGRLRCAAARMRSLLAPAHTSLANIHARASTCGECRLLLWCLFGVTHVYEVKETGAQESWALQMGSCV